MKRLLLCTLLLPSCLCMLHPAGRTGGNAGPYVDSIGYRAAQARIEAVARESEGTLISEALAVQNDSADSGSTSAFFTSLEESYQRYLKLFKPVRHAPRPRVRCRYDLIETFKNPVLDPQPFINALLHTMSLTEVTTLDFRIEPESADTTLLYVSLTKTESLAGGRVSLSEGDLILSVTRHTATLRTAVP